MREALFLTFGMDLGFFERQLLGPVRSTGAAVTVIGDARMFTPDPREVRSAGRAYTLGLAAAKRAFHPKVTVLVGPERALVGVGSGNLSVGGWHGNDEVLTVARANLNEGVPRVVADLIEALVRLAEQIPMGGLAAEGVKRTVTELKKLVRNTQVIDTGHRLVDSLTGPIVDQLPQGPVSALEVSAPFFDPHGAALAELVRRFQPEDVTVLTQPGKTVIDPEPIIRTAKELGVNVRFEQLERDAVSGPYRHGKILTALQGQETSWSLVGSPNMSTSALTCSATGGNVEIAVLMDAGISLLPTPRVRVAEIPALAHAITSLEDSAPQVTGPLLLEALAVEGGLEITLLTGGTSDVPIEVSHYAGSPEHFELLGTVPAGATQARFPGDFLPGTRFRAGDSFQTLADRHSVTSRLLPLGRGKPNQDASLNQLFASESLAANWINALQSLVHGAGVESGSSGTKAHAQDAASDSTYWAHLDDPEQWAAYAQESVAKLGLPMFELAAGTTVKTTVGATLPVGTLAWDDTFDDDGADDFEGEETAEETTDVSGDQDSVGSQAEMSPGQQARYRGWIGKIVGLVPHLGPFERISMVQLTITASLLPFWSTDRGASGWFEPLRTALEGLAGEEWPVQVRDRIAAAACVGLYRLRTAVPPDERGTHAEQFKTTLRHLGPLVEAAQLPAIEDILHLLDEATLVARSAEEVKSELTELLQVGPEGTLTRVIESNLPGVDRATWTASKHLVLDGDFTNAKTTAAQVLTYAKGLADLVLAVNSSNGSWTVVVRAASTLAVIEGGQGETTYRAYDTGRLIINPYAPLTDPQRAQQARISKPPFATPGPEVREILDRFDIQAVPITAPTAVALKAP